MERLSVVISNYNYERFVGEAIDSALALPWPDVEVVVVDDGSTDNSLDVIRGYGDRVVLLATENSSQRVAVNRGFAASTGDVVIFLDADDLLPADLPVPLSAVMGPAVSKVQFQMQRVDASGAPLGLPFPAYDPPPPPATVRRWLLATSAYPTPPGSGNAYARWFLDRVLPAGPEVGDAGDSALLAAAPLLGDVVSVPGVVVGYRQHGRNDSNLLNDVSRFPREVARARARWHFAQCAAGNVPANERPLFASRELLQLRVASRRMAPGEAPLPGDRMSRMVRDAVLSPWRPGPEPWLRRLTVAGWCLATLAAPAALAQDLVRFRYGRDR
ncbi:glycosyltransferase family 2 protein [uncultured Friedmanniella sp.]|uniref:glycosyltransferase family 2 protein n=1 Tax=uncultured Friedmanniella sp. TaxID=335381 RepID=UPI0035C966EA